MTFIDVVLMTTTVSLYNIQANIIMQQKKEFNPLSQIIILIVINLNQIISLQNRIILLSFSISFFYPTIYFCKQFADFRCDQPMLLQVTLRKHLTLTEGTHPIQNINNLDYFL